MKVVQKPDKPRQYFFMAETDEDRIVLEALRICQENAVEIHRIFDGDEIYEEMISTPALLAAVTEYLSGNASLRGCGVCQVDRVKHKVKICGEHQQAWEQEFLNNIIELELKVPCTCVGLESYMPSFDPKTGHGKDCLVPALQKVKDAESTEDAENTEDEVPS